MAPPGSNKRIGGRPEGPVPRPGQPFISATKRLSPEARAYFAAGGLGILIGDGALNYRLEKVLESYYSYSLDKWSSLAFDYQYIAAPGYNADRGPVNIFAGRLHTQF
jgi:high affinity Mn2+ porin